MTLSIDVLRNRLQPRFPDLEQVGDSVVRFTRKAKERPFAVCYVDVSIELPESREALDAYQDKVVGRHFFDGEQSLQWSTYLFFVVDPERLSRGPFRATKELIERDRRYARKYVVTEKQLDEAITLPSLRNADGQIDAGILTTWTTILSEANLESRHP